MYGNHDLAQPLASGCPGLIKVTLWAGPRILPLLLMLQMLLILLMLP